MQCFYKIFILMYKAKTTYFFVLQPVGRITLGWLVGKIIIIILTMLSALNFYFVTILL